MRQAIRNRFWERRLLFSYQGLLFFNQYLVPSYLTARGLPIEDDVDDVNSDNGNSSGGNKRRRYQKRELAEIVVDFLGL